MKRRDFIVLLSGATAASVAWSLAVGAQTRGIRRIGYLASSGPAMTGRMVAALRQGLSDLGYIDGQTVAEGSARQRDATSGCLCWQLN